jgi:hypothetical protein
MVFCSAVQKAELTWANPPALESSISGTMLSDWLNPITLPLFKTICDSDLRAPQHCERRVVCVALRPIAADVANRSQLIPERARVILSQGSKLSPPQPILRLLNRMSSCRSEDPRHDIGLSIPAIFRSKISQVFFYQKLRFLFRNKPGCPCKGYSFSPDPLLDLFPVHLLLQLKNP